MKRIFWSVILVSFILYSISLGWAQDRPIHIGFTGLNLEQNNLTVMGVGSGEYPLAELSFGYIPSNNAFDDATNGWGAIVNADPGEGIVILAPTVNTDSAALIRCSVRSSGPHVAFALASIGLDENQTVNTTVPNNGAYFVGRYQRLAGVALPPASGFQAMVQVLNTSETEPLIVYIDNFDIYPLSEGYFYHEEFIDGDIVDPPTISLMPGEVVPTATRTPEPTSTPFPNDDPYEPDGYAGQASQFSIFNQLLHNNIRVIDTDYDIDYMTFGFVPKDDAYFQSSPYYGKTKWKYEIEIEALTHGATIEFAPENVLSAYDRYDSSGGRFYGSGYPILTFKVSGDVGRYRITMRAIPLNEFPTPTPIPTRIPATPTYTPTPTHTPTPTEQPGDTIFVFLPDLSDAAKALEMVLLPAGTFEMGSLSSEKGHEMDERPVHSVTIPNHFFIGRTEITQGQWQAVMKNNPSQFQGLDRPVERVTWENCQLFVNELNKLGLGTFRLPTEAEWEYACRAGTQTRYYWGDDPGNVVTRTHAWYENNAIYGTNDVGILIPNAGGLFDMNGNVWEWCQDWYGFYSADPQTDPTGPSSGEFRVIRGGAWSNLRPEGMRAANRSWYKPSLRSHDIGFRIVMTRNSS